MKKLFENLYIFSKISLSTILLICLIGVLYIFYLNYKKEDLIAQNRLSIEEELLENINKNTEMINLISKEIKTTKSALLKINENIQSITSQRKNENISNIDENIKLLNQNFNKLSSEIKKIKESNFENDINKSKKQLKIIKSNKEELINLILIKYENNINFDNEIEFLKKILDTKIHTNYEKLLILSNKSYKGHEYLKNIFNSEVNVYLKKKINKKPTSLFSKIILPYIDISPTTSNVINDDTILKINKIKTSIENKNLENAIKNIKLINNYENNFQLSYRQLDNYINFKIELYKLK